MSTVSSRSAGNTLGSFGEMVIRSPEVFDVASAAPASDHGGGAVAETIGASWPQCCTDVKSSPLSEQESVKYGECVVIYP